MAVGDHIRVTIDRLAVGGDGIARAEDGAIVFVDGGLPGDTATVELTATKKDFRRARVIDVHDPSPARIDVACPHRHDGCGGCGWLHVSPDHQLRLKADMTADSLRRTARLPDADIRLGGSAPAGRRTTARLVVGATGLGFRRADSNDPIATPLCDALHPRLRPLLALPATGHGEVTIRCSAATGERQLWHDDPVRLVDIPDDVAVGPTTSITERIAGATLRVSAGAFFQSSAEAAQLLVETVAAAVGNVTGVRAIDLYGGVGLFATTALAAAHVTVVEQSRAACADAEFNLGHGARVRCMPVERWRPTAARVVVADPARSGLGPTAADLIADTGADVVVLVSCDLGAMGRDVRLLVDRGYRHQRAVVLDLFPDTPHTEVVTTFVR
jgi:23S rRNA (uracil1939-C5)-methyltransferase